MQTSEVKLRLRRLSDALSSAGIDAALVAVPVNLFYLTGTIFNGSLYLDAKGRAYAFARYVQPIDGVECVVARKPELIPGLLRKAGVPLPETLMLEDDYLPANLYARLSQVFDGVAVKRDLLRSVRCVKTAYEQEQLKLSATAHARAYARIPALLHQSTTDLDLTIEIERAMRLEGCLGIMRLFGTNMEIHMGSVLAGDNALARSPYDFAMGGTGVHPSLPISASGTPLREGTTVMVDMGGNFTGYISDMTRTYAVGSLPQQAYDLHNLSISIQRELSRAKAGDTCEMLYERGVQLVREAGAWDYYMEPVQGSRFVGHGIGLEVNELPVLCAKNKTVLEEGMVVALEPKFVLPGVGPLGTENTYIVRSYGLECITSAPEEL